MLEEMKAELSAMPRAAWSHRLESIKGDLADADAFSTPEVLGAAGYFRNLRETQPYQLSWENMDADETVIGFHALAEKLLMSEKTLKRRLNDGRGTLRLTLVNPASDCTDTLTVTRLKR